jgi:clan AA aspartic protease (TIGR02281 family)
MRARNVFSWSSVAIVAMVSGTVLAGSFETESTAVAMRVSETGRATIRLTINGGGPYAFVVDTGSNRTAVTSRLAARLGLRPVATTAVVTSASTAMGAVIELDEVTVGTVTRRALPAAVLPEGAASAVGRDADGLLGQDFLKEQNYTLDYARGRLVWNDRVDGDRGAVRLALRADEGRWLVALPQDASERQPLWFVPDSGAQSLVLFDRGAAPRLPLSPLPGVFTSSTVLGSSNVRASLVGILRVGALLLRDQPAIVVERREPDAPAGDGLLPLSAFARVTFLGTEQVLIVQPR